MNSLVSPQISIIIPVYNVEKYLSRCIDSILSQTYSDYELILINDGSTDKSGSICNNYAKLDNRIVVIHTSNKGASAARNIGIINARGKYIKFIDSDDYVEKSHLSDFFYDDSYDYDLRFQGFLYQDARTHGIIFEKLPLLKLSITKDESIKLIADIINEKLFGYTWNKLFKREIILKHSIRFNENISLREDEIFTFEYCKYVTSILQIPSKSYIYMRYNSSLMNCGKYNVIDLMDIFNISRNTALQITSNDKYTLAVNKYYLNSLIGALYTEYSKEQKVLFDKRLIVLRKIKEYHKKSPTQQSKMFLFTNIYLIDIYYNIRFRVKRFILNLKKI